MAGLKFLLFFTSIFFCRAQEQPSAALVIGGYTSADVNRESISNRVELFGCDQNLDYVVDVEPFPERISSTSGLFIPTDEGGGVLVCGGFACPENETCARSNRCYAWNPRDNQWTLHSELNEPRALDVMLLAPNLDDSASEGLYPLALGGNVQQTEIYNENEGEWQLYRNLSSNAYDSYKCLAYNLRDSNDGLLYSIDRNNITTLNLLDDFDFVPIGSTPDPMTYPLMCSLVNIGGTLGIYTRYGYWYNIRTDDWEKKALPPLNYLSANRPPNAMYRFRELPTIFGFPQCDDRGECPYIDVLQYQADTDSWVNLGSLLEEARSHLVIEVPGSFCNYFTPEAEQFQQTGALIVGGFYGNDISIATVTDSVELFGCSSPVSPLPIKMGLSAGTFIHDGAEGYVLVCGGYQCPDDGGENPTCAKGDICYTWRPTDNVWTEHSRLATDRWDHAIFQAPVPDGEGIKYIPLVFGGSERMVETYDEASGNWTNYAELPDLSWLANGCLVQSGDKVYRVGRDRLVSEVNLADPELAVNEIGSSPLSFSSPLTCSIVEIGGEKGIYVRYGYWFNLEQKAWSLVTPPPLSYLSASNPPNSMMNFRRRPTYFGFPYCDNLGECTYDRIIQYNSETDEWDDEIGRMSEPKKGHVVIEVPSDFCSILSGNQT